MQKQNDLEAFQEMVKEFGKFLCDSPLIKNHRLQIFSDRANEFIVYQGSLQTIWAILRLKGCRFSRTSLLRAVKSQEGMLGEYFQDYKIGGGV